MISPQKNTVWFPAAAAILAAACYVPRISAQSPAATPANQQRDDPVMLSEFEVRGATEGYRAESAVTGLKYDVPVRDVPLNMTILTSDLLRDIQPIDFQDVKAMSVSHAGPFRGNVIRGFSVSREFMDGHVFPARVGHGETLERVEIIKGPAGVLYGQTSPGGVINYIRKRPVAGRPFTHVTFGVGNHERYKVAVDFNNESRETFMASKLRYRLSAAWGQNESEQGAGQKYGYNDRMSLLLPVSFNPWKNTVVTAHFQYAKRHLTSREGETARSILQNGVPISRIYNIDPYLDFGAGIHAVHEVATVGVDLDHRVGDNLLLRASIAHNKNIRDDTGDPRPSLQFRMIDGKPAVARTFTLRLLDGKDDSANIYAKYSADFINASHDFLAGANYSFFREATRLGNWLDATGAVMTEHVFFLEQEPWGGLPSTGFRQNIVSHVRAEDEVNSVFLNYLGRYMDRRLNVLAGMSRFQSESVSRNRIAGTRDTVDRPGKFAPQAGALYNVTPALGLFAVYSSSYEISHRKDGYDRPFSPSVANGIELGAKWSLNNDRLLATFTYYSATNKDIIVFDPNAPNNVFDLTNNPVNLGAWVQKGEVEAEGFEAEIVGRLGGLQALLGYGYNDAQVSDDSNPANIGNPLPFQTPHRVVIWGRYNFSQGPLQGLSLGGGYQYNHDAAQLVSGRWTTDEAWWRLDAFASYRTEFRGTPVIFQINGKNLNKAKNGPIFGSVNPQTGRRFSTEWGKPMWWLDVRFEF